MTSPYKNPFYLFENLLAEYFPATDEKKTTFVKTNTVKTDDGYRVSVTRFVNGDSHSIVDTVATIEDVRKFIKDNS